MRPSSPHVRECPEDALGFRRDIANDDCGWLLPTDEADTLSRVVGHRREIAGHAGQRRREVVAEDGLAVGSVPDDAAFTRPPTRDRRPGGPPGLEHVVV